VTLTDSGPVYKVVADVRWVQNTQLSTRTVGVFNPEGTLTIVTLLEGLSITPATHTLTHAEGELRIDSSTNPPTYAGTSSTEPWQCTWISSAPEMVGPAGGPWFFGEGTVVGNTISGAKNMGDITYTYRFVKAP
jgi:hypothetical protein